jgi:hypothetical protein
MNRFINYIKYAMLIIKNSPLLSMLVFINLIISSYAIYAINIFYVSKNSEFIVANNFAEANCVYFHQSPDSNFDLSNIKDIRITSDFAGSSILYNDEPVRLYFYKSDIAQIAKIPLSSGRWFNSTQNGMLELVGTSNLGLTVGDIIEITYDKEQSRSINAQAIIVGIVPESFLYYNMTGGSFPADNMRIDNLFNHGSASDKMMFCSSEQAAELNIWITNPKTGRLFIFEDDISEVVYNENMSYLNSVGSAAPVENMLKNSKEEYKQRIFYLLPYIIFIVSIVLIASYFLIKLTLESSKYLLAVLSINGAMKKDLGGVVIAYSSLIIIGAVTLNLLISRYTPNLIAYHYVSNDVKSYALHALISLSYGLVFVFGAKGILNKKSLILNIKEKY